MKQEQETLILISMIPVIGYQDKFPDLKKSNLFEDIKGKTPIEKKEHLSI